jgi:arylsulfatase A-like enzyme
MWKTVKISCLIFLTFFTLALCLYIFIIHPNDQRLTPVPPLSIPLQKQPSMHLKGRLFDPLAPLPSTSSIAVATYQDQLQALRTRYPNQLTHSSSRFQNPYQLFVAVGSHPERLEGRHAIALFPGESLTLTPGFEGFLELQLGLFLFEDTGTLQIQKNGRTLTEHTANPVSTPHDIRSFYYRNIHRFFFPDAPVPGGTWQSVSTPVSLRPTDTLTLKCLSQQGTCFVSEPSLWAAQGDPKPNFIVILVDTLRHDALQARVAPFLHRLQTTSRNFIHTLAAGNMTTPSTNALLSCQSPSHIGNLAFAYAMEHADKESFYQKKQASFPAILDQKGWKTAMIGNISVISDIQGRGLDHGFSQQIARERDAYDTPHIAHDAVEWLKENHSRPFFLYLHFHAPHAPYRAPFRDIFATFPGWRAFTSYATMLNWLYTSTVHYTDRYVEQVFQTLETFELLSNTHILFTADHGESQELRTFVENEIGPAYTGSFYDHGATLYNDEVQVPLFLVSPHFPTSHKYSTFVSGLDIAPTLLDLAGQQAPTWCDGISLRKALETRTEPPADRILASEGFNERAILIHNRFKYIRAYRPTEKRLYLPGAYFTQPSEIFAEEQLYDIHNDPNELHNLMNNKSEMTKARDTFRSHFKIPDSYQLVVENPAEKEIRITTDVNVELHRSRQPRVLLLNSNFILHPPTVYLDGEKIALHATSMRLPLHLPLAQLPREERGEEALLHGGTRPFAYLQRVEMDHVKERKISTGDPQFEKILREWGYLNEK